jgi:hypothetical protein
MITRRLVLLSAAVVPAAVLPASPSRAHHGFTGRYDTDKPLFLVGTVMSLAASPPHPVVTLRVEPSAIAPPSGSDRPTELTGDFPQGIPLAGQTVQIEFPPVQTFFALRDRLKPGDPVEIVALRNCRPPNQLRSQWIRLPGREIIQREGRLSYMARGCEGG